MTGKASLFELAKLPQPFGVTLLILSLILLLSPYLSGADFGIFKIPNFTDKAKRNLKVMGPLAFITMVLLFVPLIDGPQQIAESIKLPVSTPSITIPPSPTPQGRVSPGSNTDASNSPIPIRYWIKDLPEVPGGDAAKLWNNALGSWQAVVATPIRRADSEAEANVIVLSSPDAGAEVSQIGPPRSKDGPPITVRFGSTVQWTPRIFEAASCRMIGHILGLGYTSTHGQVMSEDAQFETLPLTPQADDIQRIREIWGK